VRGAIKQLRPTPMSILASLSTTLQSSSNQTNGVPMVLPINLTPELKENGRYRYEETDEPTASIAEDLGVHPSTLIRLVKRWGWKNRKDRKRDLHPAVRLSIEADKALRATIGKGEDTDQADTAGTSDTGNSAADATAPAQPSLAERLERAIEKELAAVETMRAQLGPQPQPPADGERTARTLASLTNTLFKVRRLRSPEMPMTGPDDFDDMPRDIDEFRHALARRH
jgi:hypothetical protein